MSYIDSGCYLRRDLQTHAHLWRMPCPLGQRREVVDVGRQDADGAFHVVDPSYHVRVSEPLHVGQNDAVRAFDRFESQKNVVRVRSIHPLTPPHRVPILCISQHAVWRLDASTIPSPYTDHSNPLPSNLLGHAAHHRNTLPHVPFVPFCEPCRSSKHHFHGPQVQHPSADRAVTGKARVRPDSVDACVISFVPAPLH